LLSLRREILRHRLIALLLGSAHLPGSASVSGRAEVLAPTFIWCLPLIALKVLLMTNSTGREA
jgi:hypothetical protein